MSKEEELVRPIKIFPEDLLTLLSRIAALVAFLVVVMSLSNKGETLRYLCAGGALIVLIGIIAAINRGYRLKEERCELANKQSIVRQALADKLIAIGSQAHSAIHHFRNQLTTEYAREELEKFRGNKKALEVVMERRTREILDCLAATFTIICGTQCHSCVMVPIYDSEKGKDYLRVYSYSPEVSEARREGTVPLPVRSNLLVARVFDRGEVLATADFTKDGERKYGRADAPAHYRSILAGPLNVLGVCVGVVSVDCIQPNTLSERYRDYLGIYVDLISAIWHIIKNYGG